MAQRLKRILSTVKGAADISISRADYQPEYHVDFDREKLALYGLNLSTAAMALRNRVNGATASYYREDGDEYDIKVMFDPQHRQSISSIENILIYNAMGEGIRVKEVGTVVERFTPPTIERKDRERIITVSTVAQAAKVYALDGKGVRIREVPAELNGGSLTFRTGPESQTLWYEVAAE